LWAEDYVRRLLVLFVMCPSTRNRGGSQEHVERLCLDILDDMLRDHGFVSQGVLEVATTAVFFLGVSRSQHVVTAMEKCLERSDRVEQLMAAGDKVSEAVNGFLSGLAWSVAAYSDSRTVSLPLGKRRNISELMRRLDVKERFR